MSVAVIVSVVVVVVTTIVVAGVLGWYFTSKKKGNCSNGGTLVHGVCHCVNGWGGDTCEQSNTNEDCGGCENGGVCQHGVCHCIDGWSGDRCIDQKPEVCSPACSSTEICQHGECHPILQKAVIVIRHGEKFASDCDSCCNSCACDDDSNPCSACCKQTIKNELNVLGYDIDNVVFANLTDQGVSQARAFPSRIKRIMQDYNLAPVSEGYTVDYVTSNNANTLLTSSPYLLDAGFTKETVVLYNEVPPPLDTANGSTFIAGNGETLAAILPQLCEQYNVAECPTRLERGKDILVFGTDGSYIKCNETECVKL